MSLPACSCCLLSLEESVGLPRARHRCCESQILPFRRTDGPSPIHVLSLIPLAIFTCSPSRLASQHRKVSQPAWTPDGREIVFSSGEELWRTAVSGSGRPERLPFGADQFD